MNNPFDPERTDREPDRELVSPPDWQIIGHEWAVKSLRQHVTHGIHKQAYLITGPESVGRRTLAIRFAQALNCPQAIVDGIPCLDCSTCGQIERMVHPDLTVIKPERSGSSLKVEQVRELQYGLHLAPHDAAVRIALLLNFEAATENAANALLKTLEEPPDNVIILITAESAERLLPTIISRCEVIKLRPVPSEILNQGMQSRWLISADRAELLTNISGGRPGYSFTLLQQPQLLELRKGWIDDLNSLLSSNRVARFAYAEQAAKNNNQLHPLLKTWLGFWRDVMLRSRNKNAQITNIDFEESIDSKAQYLDEKKIFEIVLSLDEIFYHLDHNVNPRLAMENLMLTLPFN